MQTENVLQVVLSHFVLFVVFHTKRYRHSDNKTHKYYYPNYNVHGVVHFDFHVEHHSDSARFVADSTGVQPFILRSYGVDSENAAAGEGRPI